MDILDIDEALKDDSFMYVNPRIACSGREQLALNLFCFTFLLIYLRSCLEDKTHDDVSNILQQWKSNNCLLPTQYQQEQGKQADKVLLRQQHFTTYFRALLCANKVVII